MLLIVVCLEQNIFTNVCRIDNTMTDKLSLSMLAKKVIGNMWAVNKNDNLRNCNYGKSVLKRVKTSLTAI